jgi:hypothetical protein
VKLSLVTHKHRSGDLRQQVSARLNLYYKTVPRLLAVAYEAILFHFSFFIFYFTLAVVGVAG